MCSSIITHVIRDLCGCASGFRVVYDVTKPVGSRVTSVSVRCQNCTYPYYEDLHEDRMYNVLINNYMFGGGDGYDLFKNNVMEFLDYGKLHSWLRCEENSMGEWEQAYGTQKMEAIFILQNCSFPCISWTMYVCQSLLLVRIRQKSNKKTLSVSTGRV